MNAVCILDIVIIFLQHLFLTHKILDAYSREKTATEINISHMVRGGLSIKLSVTILKTILLS